MPTLTRLRKDLNSNKAYLCLFREETYLRLCLVPNHPLLYQSLLEILFLFFSIQDLLLSIFQLQQCLLKSEDSTSKLLPSYHPHFRVCHVGCN